jgi:hypothetical protein
LAAPVTGFDGVVEAEVRRATLTSSMSHSIAATAPRSITAELHCDALVRVWAKESHCHYEDARLSGKYKYRNRLLVKGVRSGLSIVCLRNAVARTCALLCVCGGQMHM